MLPCTGGLKARCNRFSIDSPSFKCAFFWRAKIAAMPLFMRVSAIVSRETFLCGWGFDESFAAGVAEKCALTVRIARRETLLPLSLGCADPAPLTRGATA